MKKALLLLFNASETERRYGSAGEARVALYVAAAWVLVGQLAGLKGAPGIEPLCPEPDPESPEEGLVAVGVVVEAWWEEDEDEEGEEATLPTTTAVVELEAAEVVVLLLQVRRFRTDLAGILFTGVSGVATRFLWCKCLSPLIDEL